jgi:AraC-like DNA-binding protein
MFSALTPATGVRLSKRQQGAIALLVEIPRTRRIGHGADLAALASYSPSRLRALARGVLGEPPVARHRRRRLDAAACALLRGRKWIRRLAQDAGFASTEAFHRAFRARFGCTPGDWARSGPPPQAPRAFAIGAGIARLLNAREEPHHG